MLNEWKFLCHVSNNKNEAVLKQLHGKLGEEKRLNKVTGNREEGGAPPTLGGSRASTWSTWEIRQSPSPAGSSGQALPSVSRQSLPGRPAVPAPAGGDGCVCKGGSGEGPKQVPR